MNKRLAMEYLVNIRLLIFIQQYYEFNLPLFTTATLQWTAFPPSQFIALPEGRLCCCRWMEKKAAVFALNSSRIVYGFVSWDEARLIAVMRMHQVSLAYMRSLPSSTSPFHQRALCKQTSNHFEDGKTFPARFSITKSKSFSLDWSRRLK